MSVLNIVTRYEKRDAGLPSRLCVTYGYLMFSMYVINDRIVEVEVSNASGKRFDERVDPVTTLLGRELRNELTAKANGEPNSVWSDKDAEEPSSRFYFATSKRLDGVMMVNDESTLSELVDGLGGDTLSLFRVEIEEDAL